MGKLSPGWGGHKESFRGRAEVLALPLPTGLRLEVNRRLPGASSDSGRRQSLGGQYGSDDPHPHNAPLFLEHADLIQYSKWVPQIQKALHNIQPHLSLSGIGDCLCFVGDSRGEALKERTKGPTHVR